MVQADGARLCGANHSTLLLSVAAYLVRTAQSRNRDLCRSTSQSRRRKISRETAADCRCGIRGHGGDPGVGNAEGRTAGTVGGRPSAPRNVLLGDRLDVCSMKPKTGFFRDGCMQHRSPVKTPAATRSACRHDRRVSRSFPNPACGNDLSTPMPQFRLSRPEAPATAGGLCAPRWREALEAGCAPGVVLRATHEGALNYCSLPDLKRLAVDLA